LNDLGGFMLPLRILLMFIITMSDHMLIINIKRLTRLVMGLNNHVTKFRQWCYKNA